MFQGKDYRERREEKAVSRLDVSSLRKSRNNTRERERERERESTSIQGARLLYVIYLDSRV